MLVTAESHNDILGKKHWGGEKKNPSTSYKASTYPSTIRKKKILKFGGEKSWTQSDGTFRLTISTIL